MINAILYDCSLQENIVKTDRKDASDVKSRESLVKLYFIKFYRVFTDAIFDGK